MILRRMADAFRTQNWFTVIIEILVVVIGIFLGLQVQEAYSERNERKEETAYLQRLHSEVVQNLGFNKTNFEELLLLENFKNTENAIGEILTAFDSGDISNLTPQHCLAVQTSAIYNDQQTYPPTLSELTASGQIAIIEDNKLKIVLSEYLMAFQVLKQQVRQLNIARTDLTDKYSHFVRLDHRMRNLLETDKFRHDCDFAAMKESQTFRNDLTVNASKLYYFNITLEKQQQSLKRLHLALDNSLVIVHGREIK